MKTETSKLLRELVAAASRMDPEGRCPRLRESDFLATFPEPVLDLVADKLRMLRSEDAPNAVLCVRTGNDDPNPDTRPEPCSMTPFYKCPFEESGWRVEMYGNLLEIWPMGGGSGGEGPLSLWYADPDA